MTESTQRVHIAGQRVHLRDITFADLDAWQPWLASGHRWQQLDAPYYHAQESDDDRQKHIEVARRKLRENAFPQPRYRLTVARRSDDAFLGFVSFYWVSKPTHWAAMGIVFFDPQTWGNGYGTEALGLWTQYLFDEQASFARLGLRTWSGNAGMMALAEKLGFSLEARFRKARIVDGDYYDGLGYGVLREEWERRYPQGFAAFLRQEAGHVPE